MNAVINYSLEVIIASVILGSFYYIFFKNSTFFRFNRFYLLSAMLLPLVFPLIQIPVANSTVLPNLSVMLDEVIVGAQGGVSIEQTPSLSGLQWFYLIVASLIVLRIVFGIISILILFKTAKREAVDDFLLYVSPKNVSPFSVFKRIVVNTTTYQDKNILNRILIHEQAHINQHHGIDVFLTEVLCALFWFNPMVWLLTRELKSTHEYLADEKVLEQDFDLSEYFMLIFDNIVGRNVVLANNFNQSLNLKRMKMMKKKRSSRFARTMSIMTMPVLVGVALFATANFVNASNDESEKKSIQEIVVVAKKGNAVPQKAFENYEPVVVKEESKIEGPIFKVVEKMPKFPGGDEALMQFLRSNVKYPTKAHENGIQGRVYVEFIVTKSGKVKNAKIIKGVHPLLDNEALRTINAMPSWEPGKLKGKAVNVSYNLPINFALQ